jgi:superfamily II RNA helicase
MLPNDMAATYTFPLDPFQKTAIAAIHREENVLVCAKTGSGKTLVGEYQIEYSIRKGGRVFYTTPIKSLSNQKFHDLKHSLKGRATVGIMTGDIKFCPDADVIVMTTEILRNLLYKLGTSTEHLGLTAGLTLQHLDAVIFDECHYINDADRGKVWEETMILLPPTVKMVMLSATLDGPESFADWLSKLKGRPTQLIQTQYRIVPLTHNIVQTDGTTVKLLPIMGPQEIFAEKTYSDWLKHLDKTAKDAADFKDKVRAIKATGDMDGPIGGKVRIAAFKHRMNLLVQHLRPASLPAIFFSLSRDKCEKYAAAVEETLIDSSDAAAVRHIIDFHLHRYNLEQVPQYHTIRALLLRGIAFHHSGVLPLLKEIIEILFTRGYVKLLFATETFAVGLNMPTKTVVFLGVKKYDDATEGFRCLRTDEYIQMAGRAGRRGKDTEGTVIYFPDNEPISCDEMRRMMCGGKARIQSRMDFGYDFILKTLHTPHHNWRHIMNDSYWNKQAVASQEEVNKEIAALEEKIAGIRAVMESPAGARQLAACRERREIETRLSLPLAAKQRKEAERKLAQWNAEYGSHSMTLSWTSFNRLIALEKEYNALHASLKTDVATITITPRIQFLEDAGYLQNVPADLTTLGHQHLTTRGILATEINEGNQIVMTELYLSGLLKDLGPTDLCRALSIFMEPARNNDHIWEPAAADPLLPIMAALERTVRDLKTKETVHGIITNGDEWDITTFWMDPMMDWVSGQTIAMISSKYDVFEGNLVRMIHKMQNLLDEYESLATYCGDVDEIKKVQAIRPHVVRDVAESNSLYLTL